MMPLRAATFGVKGRQIVPFLRGTSGVARCVMASPRQGLVSANLQCLSASKIAGANSVPPNPLESGVTRPALFGIPVCFWAAPLSHLSKRWKARFITARGKSPRRIVRYHSSRINRISSSAETFPLISLPARRLPARSLFSWWSFTIFSSMVSLATSR